MIWAFCVTHHQVNLNVLHPSCFWKIFENVNECLTKFILNWLTYLIAYIKCLLRSTSQVGRGNYTCLQWNWLYIFANRCQRYTWDRPSVWVIGICGTRWFSFMEWQMLTKLVDSFLQKDKFVKVLGNIGALSCSWCIVIRTIVLR